MATRKSGGKGISTTSLVLGGVALAAVAGGAFYYVESKKKADADAKLKKQTPSTPSGPLQLPSGPITPQDAAALIATAKAIAGALPDDQKVQIANQLSAAANQPGVDAATRAALLAAAAQVMPVTKQLAMLTGTAGVVARGPTAGVLASYGRLRTQILAFLQGHVSSISHATLGAADRIAHDLHRAGDIARASDLGALATAAYARARVPRPMAFAA